MDEVAISVGWALCTTLLSLPIEACASDAQMRFLGTVGMIAGVLAVTVPLTLHFIRPRARRRDEAPREDLPPLPALPSSGARPPSRLAVEVERLPRRTATRPQLRSVQ